MATAGPTSQPESACSRLAMQGRSAIPVRIEGREADDEPMTDAASSAHVHVTIHLMQQATVAFDASELWPLHGAYSRFGSDLRSFAEEVTRRLRSDGYLGFSVAEESITIVPSAAVKRIDFTTRP
jgi:hypothetical protein